MRRFFLFLFAVLLIAGHSAAQTGLANDRLAMASPPAHFDFMNAPGYHPGVNYNNLQLPNSSFGTTLGFDLMLAGAAGILVGSYLVIAGPAKVNRQGGAVVLGCGVGLGAIGYFIFKLGDRYEDRHPGKTYDDIDPHGRYGRYRHDEHGHHEHKDDEHKHDEHKHDKHKQDKHHPKPKKQE